MGSGNDGGKRIATGATGGDQRASGRLGGNGPRFLPHRARNSPALVSSESRHFTRRGQAQPDASARFVQQPGLMRKHRELGAVIHVELHEQPPQIRAHRRQAQEEFIGDLLV